MPRNEVFRHEQHRVAVGMVLAVIVTAIMLSLAAFWDPEKTLMVPVAERLQTALRADVFVIGWLAAAIANVARLRFFSIEDIAGSSAGSGSQSVRDAVAILQNTAEQVVLAVLTHLVFAAVVGHPTAILMTLAAMFCVGRTLFWVGYKRGARGRALGFALTFYPTVTALGTSAAMLLLGRSG
ncbi:MAPEG family protein [Methylobacterium sp. WL30]|uniref:MAPEG family protein n=1 Tax=unclassified Methylobacterium TaxID=2615210 RepID=UPI0011C71062|nr:MULTISPECIES: MAPEG family protein [unclassified Methylobacterium]TXN39945.1 MAPEG family protein [Methylobacterium sp. WL93]TXN46796.1 MAPEG family protein [Methylobacterium sp. WL119]TXN62245.1 MAPEG family protein [Methylobacterium sp. WL30]